MNEITVYQFSIEDKSGKWVLSPEYKTLEDCFAAAMRCTKHLGKQYQRVTFTTRTARVSTATGAAQ